MTFSLAFVNIEEGRQRPFFRQMNIIEKIIAYLKEVQVEMKKVNWPTRDQTIRYTLIVIGLSVAVAIYLGSLDFIFTTLLNMFLIR